MPSSLLAATAASAAGAGVNFGLSKLLGGSGESSGASFSPPGINAGGLSATFSGGNYNVNSNQERRDAVGNVASTFGQQADALAALAPLVVPGFSELRRVKQDAIERARVQSIGDLRSNLARRRVSGSSFAQDALSRSNAEFAAMQEQSAAESLMQELEASVNLINQQFTARRGQFQTALDEMNLEANLAASLAGKATDALQKNAATTAQLDYLTQKGQGAFANELTRPIGDAFGKWVGSLNLGSKSNLAMMPTDI